MYLIVPLSLVFIFNLYLLLSDFLKNEFDFKIFLLAYFLFGSSIIALLTNVFTIGAILGFLPISIYVLFNFNNIIKYFYTCSIKIRYYMVFISFIFLFELIWTIFSDNIEYALEKDFIFFLYCILIFYVILIFNKRKDFDKFMIYMHFWITVYLLIMLITLNITTDIHILTNGYIGGENRIVMSRALFIYIMVSLYLANKNRLYFIAILPAIYIYLFAAARGPLVAIIAALITYTIINITRLIKNKIFYMSLILIGISIFIFIMTADLSILSEKFMIIQRLTSEDISETGRGRLLLSIIHHFQDIDILYFLLGYGVGDSAVFLGGYEYPHNILIEFFFEMGIIGIILNIFYIYFNLSIYTNKFKDRILFSLLIIHGILFFSGMFSSTLHSSSMSQLLIFSFIIYKYLEIEKKGAS